jgi:hypothetical protein
MLRAVAAVGKASRKVAAAADPREPPPIGSKPGNEQLRLRDSGL